MPILILQKEIDNLVSIIQKLESNMTHAKGRLSAYTDLQKNGIEKIGEASKDNTVYDDDI